jgi:hypothetical protein
MEILIPQPRTIRVGDRIIKIHRLNWTEITQALSLLRDAWTALRSKFDTDETTVVSMMRSQPITMAMTAGEMIPKIIQDVAVIVTRESAEVIGQLPFDAVFAILKLGMEQNKELAGFFEKSRAWVGTPAAGVSPSPIPTTVPEEVPEPVATGV